MLLATILFAPGPNVENARAPGFAPEALLPVMTLLSWESLLKVIVPLVHLISRSSEQRLPVKMFPVQGI